MRQQSAPGIRPKLDVFFESLRAALDAAAGGADRRRLEEFQVQARSVQERLYACLEQDERPELVDIARDLQVLAYRIRVLFGRPLEGVSWDAFQALLAEMPRSGFVSGELHGARETPHLPDRTLVGRQAITGGGVLTARPRVHPPEPQGPLAARPPAPAPLAEILPPHAEDPRPVVSWDFAPGPLLVSCAIFSIGAFAGSALGGLYSPLTALACGGAALAAIRPASRPVAL